MAELLSAEPQLSRLVEKFGSEAVWQTSLEVLGYPATWCDDIKELMEMKRALEGNE